MKKLSLLMFLLLLLSACSLLSGKNEETKIIKLNIPGNTVTWVDTGIKAEDAYKYHLTATGRVCFDTVEGQCQFKATVRPTGFNRVKYDSPEKVMTELHCIQDKKDPFVDAQWFHAGLIGTFGTPEKQGEVFWVSEEKSFSKDKDTTGNLLLGINDCNPGNNSGEFEITLVEIQ